jgi:hypothetical protein
MGHRESEGVGIGGIAAPAAWPSKTPSKSQPVSLPVSLAESKSVSVSPPSWRF